MNTRSSKMLLILMMSLSSLLMFGQPRPYTTSQQGPPLLYQFFLGCQVTILWEKIEK